MRPDRPVNMSSILKRSNNNSTVMPRTRSYGAGVIEVVDERLKEEVQARRNLRAPQPHNNEDSAPDRSYRETKVENQLEQACEQLVYATARRERLEAELERAKRTEDAARQRKFHTMERLKNVRKLKTERAAKEQSRGLALARRREERRARRIPPREIPPREEVQPKGPIKLLGFGPNCRIGK
jgi:hypothetical protein